MDDGEVKPPRKPLLWEVELLMTEQKEDYDEDQDPEYVPPPTCADISLDYDEVIQNAALQYQALIQLFQFVDGETEIDSEELQELRLDMQVICIAPSGRSSLIFDFKEPVQYKTNGQF